MVGQLEQINALNFMNEAALELTLDSAPTKQVAHP